MAKNYHIANAFSDLPDPQKTNLWVVEISCPPRIHSEHKKGFEEKLRLRAASCFLPNRKIQSESSFYLGHEISFPLPNDRSAKNMSIEFIEREDGIVSKIFNSWMHEIHDFGALEDGKHEKANDFKASFVTEIMLDFIGIDGRPLPIYALLHNAWPEDMSSPKFSYGSSEAVRYEVNFRFDWWSLEGRFVPGAATNDNAPEFGTSYFMNQQRS